MATRIVKVDPFDLVVFGGTGDLAYRKLYPALFHRERGGQFTEPTRIVGVSRRHLDRDAFRASVKDALVKFHAVDGESADALERFLARLDYVAADAMGEAGWSDLRETLGPDERIRAFYLATGPDLFCPIAKRLGAEGLASVRSRIIVEKPIGHDGASADAINNDIGSVFPESAIFRIDHYLGKESVQNLMALRFANALLEPVWNNAHIDHVQITVAETLGVEGRGAYYDESGAIRDMVQNHMMQLLCLVAMEPPNSMQADSLRDEKLKVLKALEPIDESNAAAMTVRGQYRAGFADGGPVPGYLHDVGKHESNTETFVAMKIAVANWRWAGVPFYLRTGKRLPQRFSEIAVGFRRVPHVIFDMPSDAIPANRLVIRVQPDEGIKLWMMVKEPGPGGMRLQHLPLDMSFAKAFGMASADAYERLLMDAIRGNAALFMRRDEVEAAWRFIDPVREAWAAMREPPRPYAAGTWGPNASVALIERDGRTWNEDITMPNSPLRRDFADDKELAPAFAEWTAGKLRAAIAERGAALLVVSGGKTPERFFEKLSTQALDWTRVAITLADERRVPDDSPRSNARLVREALLRNHATVAAFTSLADFAARPKPRNSPRPARASPLFRFPPTWSSLAWATTDTRRHGFPAPKGSRKRWTPARANSSRRSRRPAPRSRA